MITYVKGDATRPEPLTAITVILNVVNDQGGWGKGFVLALSRASRLPEYAYRHWHEDGHDARGNPFALGQVQVVKVPSRDYYVANLLAQHGYKSAGNPRPLDYLALDQAVTRLANRLKGLEGVSIHGPRIGAGLAGGHWPTIAETIERHLGRYPITIYDL